MKPRRFHIFVLLAMIISCSSSTGTNSFGGNKEQPDDSELTERQRERIRHNAEVLAFREKLEEARHFINIPKNRIEYYYDILVRVLTSRAIEGRETLRNHFITRTVNLKRLSIEPVDNAPFIDAWDDTLSATGIETIDSVLFNTGFKLSEIADLLLAETRWYIFLNENPKNTSFIRTKLRETGYFTRVNNALIGRLDDINVKQVKDERRLKTLEITFKVAAGSWCLTFCDTFDHYIFYLYPDGEVIFAEKLFNQPLEW